MSKTAYKGAKHAESVEQAPPSNYVYPETNMSLTSNYFGPDDYRKKKTIDDIREQVLIDRSSKKKLTGLQGRLNEMQISLAASSFGNT